jgi:spore coat protein SA
MPIIYHLLPEAENFSDRLGGALSRWTANVLRTGPEVVVCPSFDDTWSFPRDRIYCMPGWERTRHPIHPLLYRLPWSLQRAVYLRVFRPLLEKLRPGDVVYVHNAPESASVLASMADENGFKVVLHMHNSHLTRATKEQLGALRGSHVVFCSRFLRDEAVQALPGWFERTHVVYSGADGARFSPAERARDVPTVVFTGRIVGYKGVHVLMQAMRILDQRGAAARCRIVGRANFSNNRSTRYTRYLRRILPANTELVGYKSGTEFAAELKGADIYCCPSIWKDPFPLASLEAMASGLPMVTSNNGGLPEMTANGGGVMVPPDDPGALAGALEELVRDPARRKALGEESRAAFCRHFTWGNVRSQYEQVMRSVMS